ncbi:MAG: acid phosphatase AphA [Candidatus Aminicenantes bacterium]|nr:MAG: acid phosphatase AphA [Candidatus Aminicenantes bacterium]
MFKKTSFIIAFLFILLANFTVVAQENYIKWVTFQDIVKSLENQPPMNVGFDIDDTVLFSSPGYYYGKQNYSPEDTSYLLKEEFWDEMNNGLDRFSIPKECARKLIVLHKKRGDTIYFITGRTKTKTETLTGLLAKTFDLENPNKVIFTSSKAKIAPIKENNIKIFYGDSDGDIKAAQANGIRAIRIIRAKNSTHKPLPKHGSLGEEVLVNSDY